MWWAAVKCREVDWMSRGPDPAEALLVFNQSGGGRGVRWDSKTRACLQASSKCASWDQVLRERRHGRVSEWSRLACLPPAPAGNSTACPFRRALIGSGAELLDCWSLSLSLSMQIGLDTAYWTAINHLFIWGSLVTYFAITFTMYSDGAYWVFPGSFPFIGKSYGREEGVGCSGFRAAPTGGRADLQWGPR